MVAISTVGRRVCAWCQADLGAAPGISAGAETHGICADCKVTALAEAALLGRGEPAPLPTAAECPAQLVHLEVVGHPRGGWTLAEPINATTSSIRIYRGWWSNRAAAQAALDAKFSSHG